MTTPEDPQELHARASRGQALLPEERARLKAWYARQDQEEVALLAGRPPADTLTALRGQVEAATAQLVTVSQRIQALTVENAAIRQEIALLQRHVAQSPTAQPV